jgi:hypothetical protein
MSQKKERPPWQFTFAKWMELVLLVAILLALVRLIALWPEDFVQASIGSMLLWLLAALAVSFVLAIGVGRFFR